MANYRRITAKTPLVMGRKTWESLPKRPLPGRPNIIATRNLDFLAPGAFVYSSLPPALAAARALAEYVIEPTPERILPDPLDKKVAPKIGAAVEKMSRKCVPQRVRVSW